MDEAIKLSRTLHPWEKQAQTAAPRSVIVGRTQQIHTLVDALGNPVNFLLTGGEAHDSLAPMTWPKSSGSEPIRSRRKKPSGSTGDQVARAVRPSWRRARLTCIACHGLPPAVVSELESRTLTNLKYTA
jgi:hypothetical protein